MNQIAKRYQAHHCLECDVVHYVEARSQLNKVGGKLGGALAGAAAAAVTKKPLLIALAALSGAFVGHHEIDLKLIPRCPQCEKPLKELEALIEAYFVPAPIRAFL